MLTYAIDHLNVSHVIIVGHTNCGGAVACHAAAQLPPTDPSTPLERWLAPLITLARDKHLSVGDLVVENVHAQVANVVKSDIIQKAWANGKDVWVHGWVYEIEKGGLVDLGISAGLPQ